MEYSRKNSVQQKWFACVAKHIVAMIHKRKNEVRVWTSTFWMSHQTLLFGNTEKFWMTIRILDPSIEGSGCEIMSFSLMDNPRKVYHTFTRSVSYIQTESKQILWIYKDLGCSFCKFSIASKLHDVETISRRDFHNNKLLTLHTVIVKPITSFSVPVSECF